MGRLAAAMSRLDAALYGSPLVTQIPPAVQRNLLTLAGYSAASIDGYATITRDQALQVPALSNGHQWLMSTAQQLPLTTDTGNADANQLLSILDPDVPAGWTVARTVDCLLWYEEAWWAVTDRYTSTGFPRYVRWIDNQRVRLDTRTGDVYIDSQPVDPKSVVRFLGVMDPLLARGAEAIAAARANLRAARRYATHPKPQTILTDAPGEAPMDPADAQAYIDSYSELAAAGKPVYIAGMQATEVGWTARELQLIEARQHDAVEMARLLGIPAWYVNAPATGSSLVYSNLSDVRRDLVDGALSPFLTAIEQRLSMPDVTPRGTKVLFDADSFFLRVTPDAPTPAPMPAAAAASDGAADAVAAVERTLTPLLEMQATQMDLYAEMADGVKDLAAQARADRAPRRRTLDVVTDLDGRITQINEEVE